MRKILIFILIVFLSFFLKEAYSQTIKNVSVINEQGQVRISWEYSGTNTIKIYRDALEINGSEIIFTITDYSINSYVDGTADAHINPRAYRIRELQNEVILSWSDLVPTFHASYDYDSCLQQINIKWTELIDPILIYDWIPSQFFINIIEDGTPQAKIPIGAEVNDYTIGNLLDNTNYTIFIETQWQGQDSTSNSNPIRFYTQMPVSPAYINPISTIVEGNNTNIKFNIDPNTELDTYKLLKSDSESGDFDTLETYITADYELETQDKNSNLDTDISYYKLISLNQCGYETTASGLINNIVLETEIEDFDVSLTWNKLNENMNPIEYEIYRVIDNLEPELVHSLFNNTRFKDNIESLQNYGQFCYFIRAVESGTSPIDYSQSNTSCVYLKPKVYIAEAFTPNDDGLNDEFKVIISFVPKEFDLKVYNRWGNKVFESSDYSEAWNGKFSNGSSAPTGSYIYYLRIKSPNDQIIEQRGSVMLIHP